MKSINYSLLSAALVFFTFYQARAQSFYPGQSKDKLKVNLEMPVKAYAFDLKDIRLLDSPFKENQKRNEQWLRSIDENKLLLGFRVTAGIPARLNGEPLGGWEALHVELRGHTMGHVLSALALTYASTGDDFYKQKGARLVAELAKVQNAMNRGGYLSAYPETLIDRVMAGTPVWAPWYTLHKIMAGLIDQYLYADNEEALQVATKMGDWAYTKLSAMNQAGLDRMLKQEYGGIAEPFYNLYALTGEKKYKNLAEMFYRKDVLDPLFEGRDILKGYHANTYIPIVTVEARGHELTNGDKQEKIAEFFWQTVIDHHTFAIGGNSDHEHFFAPDSLSKNMSRNTAESCNTYNMLKLTKHLFTWTADAKYADYYERALYNHILGTQDPETGMTCYFMSHQPGTYKVYGTENNSFWCCTGTGFENHSKYGEAIYFHDNDGVYVNLSIPSVLDWKEKGIKLRQETTYPESDKTKLTVEATNGQSFAVRLRYPSWATSGVTLTVNGKNESVKAKPGSYIEIRRKWQSGDVVEVRYPMQLRLVPANDNPNMAAIACGPIILAGAMGSEGLKKSNFYVKDQWGEADFKVPDNLITSIHTNGNAVSYRVKPVAGNNPLTFEVINQPGSANIKLIPYYQLHHQRYVLYWNLIK